MYTRAFLIAGRIIFFSVAVSVMDLRAVQIASSGIMLGLSASAIYAFTAIIITSLNVVPSISVDLFKRLLLHFYLFMYVRVTFLIFAE